MLTSSCVIKRRAATRHKADRRVQYALFLLSLYVGPRMIWLINRGSWLVNMRQVRPSSLFQQSGLPANGLQCPSFATAWLYTVVQMNLPLAVLSLVITGGWVWWTGMKLVL